MLTHYIIVRRDLPLGVLAAMVTHAAGESAPLYQDAYDGRFRHARAVVLEAKSELVLDRIATTLQKAEVQCVEIWENAGPYAEQLMAIGLVPVEGKLDILSELQTLKTCEGCNGVSLSV